MELKAFKTESFGLSDVGATRKNNEDAWVALPEEGFYVLADGLGGHNSGEIAANEAVNHLNYSVKRIEQFRNKNRTPQELSTLLRFAIKETNHIIFRKGEKDINLKGMATTLCCIYIHGSELMYSNVGDSRIYRLRNNVLELLSQDHTIVAQLVSQGELTEEEAQVSPNRNVLTKALGIDMNMEAEVFNDDLLQGDTFLLCSDGLSDVVSFNEIETIMNAVSSVEDKSKQLIAYAKKKQSDDNITVLVVHVP